MKLRVEDISYPLQTGKWVPAIQFHLDYGDKIEVRPYTWYNKHLQTKREASDYALRAGTIFARKIGLIS